MRGDFESNGKARGFSAPVAYAASIQIPAGNPGPDSLGRLARLPQQVVAHPHGGLHRFDLALMRHGRGTAWMRFGPNKGSFPSVLCRVFRLLVCGVVMLFDAAGQVLGLPDVEPTVWILDNVDKERQTPRVGLEPTT